MGEGRGRWEDRKGGGTCVVIGEWTGGGGERYRRTGFNCENLIIANCEFF